MLMRARSETGDRAGKGKIRSMAGFIILLAFAALIFFAVLELGKHTLIGWILTVLLISAYAVFRCTVLKQAGFGGEIESERAIEIRLTVS